MILVALYEALSHLLVCMPPKLRTLPIIEHWDCHGCTACCRETMVRLTADDLARLKEQRWAEHPEYRGIRVVRRSFFLLRGARVLAHKADGSCVFLTPSGRCRIHELFGAEAKPLMCRQFPFQVVRTDRDAWVTVARTCPSAAADRGQPVAEYLAGLKRLIGDASERGATGSAPPIVRRTRRGWDDFHRAAGAIERMLTDRQLPLVRRLVHCLRFARLLEECKWKRVGPDAVAELVGVLEQAAREGASQWFTERQPPSKRTSRLFRRLGAHFIRCFPGGRPTRTLADQWQAFRQGGRLARGASPLPAVHPRFPGIKLDDLERPLGALRGDVLTPLDRLFETHAASKRYALALPRHSLVDNLRRLALAFPMALWMLRWLAAGRETEAEDMVQIVVAVERGLALPALARASGFLAASGELERLIAWYAR
jgi:lysine-N-methylase